MKNYAINGVERGIRTPESIGHQISSLTPYQAGPSPHRERRQRTSRNPIKVVSVLNLWMERNGSTETAFGGGIGGWEAHIRTDIGRASKDDKR